MRNLKRVFASISTAALMSMSSPASAGGVPTFDSAAIAQIIQQIVALGRIEGVNLDQLKSLANQITLMNDQILLAEQQLRTITGARDAIADLFEGDVTADKISTSLARLRRVQGIANELNEKFEKLDETFEFVDGETLFPADSQKAQSEVYDMRLTSVKSEIVVSDKLYQDAGTAFEHYEEYRTQLGTEATNDDLKAAIDLNTRVQIENGQNLAKMLQLLSVSAQSRAIADAATIRARTNNRRAIQFEPVETGANQ